MNTTLVTWWHYPKRGSTWMFLQPWINCEKIQTSRRKKKKEKHKIKRGGKRDTYFCIWLSQLWQEKIHSFIKRLQKHHGLRWIRVRIYYHWFPNLGEILQGDIVGKIRKRIGLKYFLNLECKCNSTIKVKGKCANGDECRAYCAVYKLACRKCVYFSLCGKHSKQPQNI